MELFIIWILILWGAFIWIEIYRAPKYSIPKQKTRLLEMLSSVNSDIRIDKRDISISAENMMEIQTSILYFTKEVEDFSKNVLKNGTQEDKKFTFEIIAQFHNNLDEWMILHEKELENLKKSLWEVQQNIHQEEAQTLEIAKKRLEIQINNYENIRT